MGAELGATTSIFPYDARMEVYLRATRRAALADLADAQPRAPRRRPRGRRRTPRSTSTASCEIDLSTARAAPRRPAHPRPGAARLEGAGGGARERLPGEDLGRADRLLHQLLLRGHHAGRGRGARRRSPRAEDARARCWSRPAPSRSTRRSSATASSRSSSEFGAHGARQRLRPVHRPVAARRLPKGDAELDRHLVQPQLPGAQRRQPRHALVHRQPRDRRRLRASPARLDVQPADRR